MRLNHDCDADQRHATLSGPDVMKLIVVTPAGREKYLRLLSHHVLESRGVYEWHLWDNCRNEADRAYFESVARDTWRLFERCVV
eukprot:gene64431-88113_t